jgi:hypothetical protein
MFHVLHDQLEFAATLVQGDPAAEADGVWALPSFREKYQWPEPGTTKLLTSPSTQTKSKWLSSRVLAWRLSWLTVSV